MSETAIEAVQGTKEMNEAQIGNEAQVPQIPDDVKSKMPWWSWFIIPAGLGGAGGLGFLGITITTPQEVIERLDKYIVEENQRYDKLEDEIKALQFNMMLICQKEELNCIDPE